MITSITIGSVTISSYTGNYLFDTLSGFGSPDIKVSVKERGAYDGANLGNYNYGKRVFSIEGRVIGDTVNDYVANRRSLQKALDLTDGLQTISITTKDGLSLEFDAIVSGNIDMQYEAGQAVMSTFRIELTAPYPFILGATENTEIVPVHSGGGAEIPAELPLEIGSGGTGDTTITNDGNGKAYPVIKIYGVIENPNITNTTRGEGLSITYTLNSSADYIEIDMYRRTVKLNGITNIKQYVSGDFWALNAGDNVIRLSAGSSGGGAEAQVTYQDSYLGL